MYRFSMEYLEAWKQKPGRKPLVIRGARQVGKTWLVHSFAQGRFENLVEVNFERFPDAAELFKSNDPRRTVEALELRFNSTIRPGQTLLFLDEIQAAPAVFAALRYFFEELPELHVIAAGSLLEFIFSDKAFSVPVGRIEYLHIGPMQFEEFLLAAGEERLATFLAGWKIGGEVPRPVHEKLMGLFRVFLVVGGMPASVFAYFEEASIRASEEVRASILSTFKDDFGKYGGRVNRGRVETVFRRLPGTVGSRFKYVNVDREARSSELAAALDVLCQARIAFRVRHSAANGIPLGAQAKDSNFKMLFLDVGLMNSSLGLSLLDFESAADILLVNSGAVCEQAVGQHLLHSGAQYLEPDLYFWSREKASSAAEVDYVIAAGERVIPVEVKAGTTGRLKSLYMFLNEKNLDFGIRLNGDLPSMVEVTTSVPGVPDKPFWLLSIPLYMTGQIRRLAVDGVAMGRR